MSAIVANAILNRIFVQRPDLLKYGPEAVMNATDEVAESVATMFGDECEIGTSDVSGWVKGVEARLLMQ